MRRYLSLPILAVSLALANPALAAERAPESEMIEKLNDPEFQEGLTSMLSGLMGAMMKLPIGQFAATIEKAVPADMKKDGGLSDIDPDATIGDLAARDNPDFERDMQSELRKGTAMMGIMAAEFGILLPRLRELGDKMKRRMEDLD